VATAWYAQGERWLTVDRELVVPAGGVLHLEARQGGDLLGTFAVVNVSAVIVGGATVYRAELLNECNEGARARGRLPTIAQEPGGDPIELTPVAAFAGEPIASVLLRLLCSSGGEGVTSATHDSLSVGAALTDGSVPGRSERGQDIDRESLESIADPISGAQFAAVWRDGDTVLDVVGGLLRAAGYVLDLRTDNAGRCMLAAVPLGLPVASDLREHLTPADIAAAPGVVSRTEAELFNRFVFEANHDADGEPQITQAVRDRASIDVFNEESELTIPLPGVTLSPDVDIVAQLRAMFSRLRQLAHPRRVYDLGTLHGYAVTAQVGGTYQVTHPLLVGDAGTLGVDGVYCSLRSVSVDGWTGLARFELVSFGRAGSGWGPSLDVVGVVDAVTLAVAERQHSRETDPQTGAAVVDLDGFSGLAAGDKVYVYQAGDMDGGQALAIASVDVAARTITLQVPHAIAAGVGTVGHVAPVAWSPPATHQVYAYVGRTEVA